jgi:hypothetical protein
MLDPDGGNGRENLTAGPGLEAALARIAALDWAEEPAAAQWLEGVDGEWGAFTGLPPRIELLDDGRGAKLLAPLSYARPDGSEWPVPAGAWLDGASIPRIFWTLIGGPFEGRYRNASIVHDHYCITRSRPWRDVHRMLYEAMRCGGTSPAKAKIIYYAVYRFGPRWSGAEESLDEVVSAPLTIGAAAGLASDAEAIQAHDLDLDEIESLADARDRPADLSALEGPGDEALDRARLLVVPGVDGDAADLDAVARAAALLPGFVLSLFEREMVRIVACRGGVTDFERDLRGVTPRGWDGTGRTWDNVPGTFFKERKRVVIATIDQGGARIVPTRASGLHGSDNLVVHESLHGYDYMGNHAVIDDPAFESARQADWDKLGAYEKQDGQAGREETFAESGARFLAAPDALEKDWPNLYGYWRLKPDGGPLPSPVSAAEESLGKVDDEGSDGAIGTAELIEGAIRLDLRAEDESGAIGHAMFTVAAGDPAYPGLHARLAGLAAEEGLDGGPVLFRPAGRRPAANDGAGGREG